MKLRSYLMSYQPITKLFINLINYLLIVLFYILRPLLGPSQCRFSLSCGNYAIKQLKEQPLITAIIAICKRLWLCVPWGPIEYSS